MGPAVLVDFTNSKGQHLQATLTLPAGYQPGKKYPMLVYFYEIMSNTHHKFSMPVYDDRPQMSTYASNGYLVLAARRRLPDRRARKLGGRLRDERGEEGHRHPATPTPSTSGCRGTAGAATSRSYIADADRHLRRRGHRRAAHRPDQLLRRAVSEQRHRAAGHHRGGAGAHRRQRHALEPHPALRGAVAAVQRAQDQHAVHDPAGDGRQRRRLAPGAGVLQRRASGWARR